LQEKDMNDSAEQKIKEKYMREAVKQAEKAFLKDEVPVGCVIVRNGKIIARAYNQREKLQDATAHAEILCIKKACKKTGNYRLCGCEMFVTLEPCPMCAGAIINSRIDKVYFGAYDEKAGCCGTLYSLVSDGKFNHKAEIEGGILEKESVALLKKFFASKRKIAKER
jgi:tRNA(adenine34) deaminase